MAEQSLVDYIKQTLASGFSENEIRKTLAEASWEAREIEEAFVQIHDGKPGARQREPQEDFFTRHRRALVILLAAIVLLPVLAYGGFFLYQRFTVPKTEEAALPVYATPAQTPKTEDMEAKRDEQRIRDIKTLQDALDSYFAAKQFYPRDLTELISEATLTRLPADPKTNQLYLYTPLGDPALHYSLAFILEKGVGTLKAGLQVVSSQEKLEAEILQNQNDLIKGETTIPLRQNSIQITDLSQTSFYPQEEVSLSISAPAEVELSSAALITDGLDLVDRNPPFGFRWSAPKNPGEYQVKVFAFDKNGESYSQTTQLIVREP